METSTPLVIGIVNNTLLHSSPLTNTSNHVHPTLLSRKLAAELCPRFCRQPV